MINECPFFYCIMVQYLRTNREIIGEKEWIGRDRCFLLQLLLEKAIKIKKGVTL